MEITQQLIESFLNRTCTPEEAAAVARYLSEHPETAEKYFPTAEWDSSADTSSNTEAFWQKQWEIIERERTKQKRTVLSLVRYAAAAIILVMIGTGIYRAYMNQPEKQVAFQDEKVADELQIVENKLTTAQLVSLPDGSTVELMPASSLSYNKQFTHTKREIYLTGEAVFDVAKDSLHPFVVYSGNISTTALGTKFRVVYTNADGDAKVYLYEGKVVIQSVRESKIQKTYLLPGDALSYFSSEDIIEVERGQHTANAPSLSKQKGSSTENEENPSSFNRNNVRINTSVNVPRWYKFDKESLPNVFDQLADIYNVKITYERAGLENKYFIGRFNNTKSLPDILKTIAEINNLTVERVDSSHYKITTK